MKNVTIETTRDDNFILQLNVLYSIFKNIENGEQINFDLSNVKWLCPIVILPISAYIRKNEGSGYTKSEVDNVNKYLNTICFPDGINSVTNFQKTWQDHRSYTPISVLEKDKEKERENLETIFSNMIFKLLGSVPGIKSAVYQPIAELVTNIFEHSKNDNGFIFGQYYPNKQFLDICIVDRGRGLAKTYEEEKNIRLTDDQAIEEVLKGHSTKNSSERGFGIRTSKSIVCKCFDGHFTIISGSYAFIASKNREQLVSLPNFYWQGVIIGYRINKPDQAIDITPYLE